MALAQLSTTDIKAKCRFTDAEWHYIEPLLPTFKATGRPRKWDLRLVVNALFYMILSGYPWRMLPREFPPWPTVHDFYRRIRLDGTWKQIHTELRQKVRRAMGREDTPSGASLDSQSIKTTDRGGPKGYSGLLERWVQENLGWHLEIVKRVTPGELIEQAWATARERQKQGASVIEMWARSKMSRGVIILPRHWVVESIFAWLTKSRRLAKDYEFLP